MALVPVFSIIFLVFLEGFGHSAGAGASCAKAACAAGTPQFSLDLPKLLIDPSKLAGTWYEYMRLSSEHVTRNRICTRTNIGAALPGSATLGESSVLTGMVMNQTVSILSAEDPAVCQGRFDALFFASDGKINSLAQPDANAPPSFVSYDIMYTDYTTVEIHTRCGNANFATSSCDKEIITVQTRTKPTELTDDEKTSIAQAVDAALKPYCVSSKNLTLTLWDTSLPECDPDQPDDYVELIQTLAKYF